MTQEGNTDNELELLHEHLPDPFLKQVGNLAAKVDESELTDREYLAYVFAEYTDKTGAESAELMKISEGTYWGKTGRARDKIDAAELTITLTSLTI